MNPSLIVANFRDVGATVNALGDRRILKEGVLYRGGALHDLDDLALIDSPRTIVNLRKGSDSAYDGVSGIHCPAPDSVEVYSVISGSNRKWILSVLASLVEPSSEPPYYVHCAAGKDRTGIIVAAVLSAMGVERELILDDYMLSSGDLQPNLFDQALDDFADPTYFRRVDLDLLRELFLV